MEKKDFSERLTIALEKRNMSKSELADKIGVRKSSVSDWTNGRYEAGQENLYLISKTLNISPSWLMGFGDEMTSKVSVPFTGARNLIKVVGTVPAGIPIEAIEEIIDYEEIDIKLVDTGSFFGLKIKGDSMAPKITEGDTVIVKQQDDVDNGDVAIVIVNGQDATCKKVMKSDAGLMLVPLNQSYEPTLYSPEDVKNIPVRIVGKVVELRRKF